MDIPAKIRYAADRLKKGHRVNRITVRDFLGHFDAERRGRVKVEAIRQALDSLGIETRPDFESGWLDGPISLCLKDGVSPEEDMPLATDMSGDNPIDPDQEEIVLEGTPAAVTQALEQVQAAPTSTEPDVPNLAPGGEGYDPTFRIGSLDAANKNPFVVNQDDKITKAVTLMLERDFSQVPVMQGEREVKGVITWKSIGTKLALASRMECVADYREEARIVDANCTLFEAIPIIAEYGYVLVRGSDRKIQGPVTASDLSLHLQSLTEPFLFLREIELHVRRLIKGKITVDDLSLVTSTPPAPRQPRDITDLTFGEYVRLLEHPKIWAKLQSQIDRAVLTRLLDEIRVIRNEIMHFDPDPLTSDQLRVLKRGVRLMQELYKLLPDDK
jgi:CBS domain-containing protein